MEHYVIVEHYETLSLGLNIRVLRVEDTLEKAKEFFEDFVSNMEKSFLSLCANEKDVEISKTRTNFEITYLDNYTHIWIEKVSKDKE